VILDVFEPFDNQEVPVVARFEVMPGQYVTDEVYEKVRALLAAEASHLFPALSWEQFTRPPGGVLAIPDNRGEVSKVELILASDPEATVKVNRWDRPDLRAGDRPAPHNHRWSLMESTILSGGYAEARYRAVRGGVESEQAEHTAGQRNQVPHPVFHEVTEILAPGETWTLMICGVGQPGDWGYLDPDTGHYKHNKEVSPDPNFAATFKALNPHTAGA
jgi:hypothetical protein